MAPVVLQNITKYFTVGDRPLPVLEDVSITAGPGEFVSVIGPSGCGKSTLFNIICGLTAPDFGRVVIRGETDPQKGRAAVAYMPQKDLLLPWRSVLDNVILAPEIAGANKAQIKQKARELLPLFGLAGFEHSYPAELSGGMRQRAALMRTFLAHRPVLLLDEPFGALDAITRLGMQKQLLQIWAQFKTTVIFITHDVEEAIMLSDHIYVLTPRPGTVCLHLPINLPRPRPAGVMADTGFMKLKRQILAQLL